MKIAVIGAGISGLAFAKEMQKNKNCEVIVFEKSKGLGGRMATRYENSFTFDHGAQHFTIRNDIFKNFLRPYFEDGTIRLWEGTISTLSRDKKNFKRLLFEPHYVACPNMNSLAKKIGENLNIVRETEIAPVTELTNQGWRLFDKNGVDLGLFDWCISSAPVLQTIRLLPKLAQSRPYLFNAKMNSNFTLMIGLKEKPQFNWIAAKVLGSPIGWISANHSKPFRDPHAFSLVVQSTEEWADENLENDLTIIQDLLLNEAQSLCQFKTSPEDIYRLHRWRYARVCKPLSHPFVLDRMNKLAAIGDGCLEGRIEDSWLSGDTFATEFLNE